MATKQYKVEIRDGRQLLSAGDADRQLVLSGFTENITQVQFDDIHGSETLDVNVVKDGDNYICDIPNQLLTGKYSELIGYVVAADDKGSYTVCKARFEITVRQTSGGYICDPMRLETWAEILAQATAAKDAAATSAEEASAAETHCEEISEWVDDAQAAVSADAKQVAADKAAVETLKTDIESIVSQGKTDIETAKTDAVAAVKAQQTTSVSAVESAGTTAQSNIASDKSAALKAVQDQQSASVTAVQSQQTSSVNAVKAQETSSKAVLSEYEARCKSYSDSAASSKSAAATSESNAATSEANAKVSEEKTAGYVSSLKTFETVSAEPVSSDKILLVNSSNEGRYLPYGSLLDYVKAHESGNATWAAIAEMIDANTFKDSYPAGSAITTTLTYSGTTYEMPWIVVDPARDVVFEDGSTGLHRPILQTMYLPPMAHQFGMYRAFLACPDGLAAGSYKLAIEATWSALTTLEWYFTLTHAVPSGGRLGGFRVFADNQNNLNVYTYGNDGKLLYTDKTLTSTAIDGATDLGILGLKTRSGNLNCLQECGYGFNEYEYTAIAQYLDSDASSNYWAMRDQWDCAPDDASGAGFLSYLDPEFVSMLKWVQVKTGVPYCRGAQADYDTGYHRCWLPSTQEMYCAPYDSSTKTFEGAALPYWKDRIGTDSPAGLWTTNASLRMYNIQDKATANYYWLRSAYRSYAYLEFIVLTSGFVSRDTSYYPHRFAPLVCL